MVQVLAIARQGRWGASTRYRLLQYISPLAQRGIALTVVPLYPEWIRQDYRAGVFSKVRAIPLVCARQVEQVYRLALGADVLVVLKDAAPYDLGWFFKLAKGLRKKTVFEIDDAIYLNQSSHARAQRYATLANVVVAGNATLAGWARGINARTIVIPTAVDMQKYRPKTSYAIRERPVRIGWIGSAATDEYLDLVSDVLAQVGRGVRLKVLAIGARHRNVPGVEFESVPWSEVKEANLIEGCDIGIAPTPNTSYARGKCATKTLQFMAAGVPVIASPVGANQEVVEHGQNGWLADSPREWYEALVLLCQSEAWRQKLGTEARRTVAARYSVEATAGQREKLFREMLGADS